jgi:hypothetical protein
MISRIAASAILVAMASRAWADGPKKPEKSIPWVGYNVGVHWESSFEDAIKKARELKRPIMVHQLVGSMKAEGC